MNPFLLGVFVAVPLPNARRIHLAHKAIDTFLGACMKCNQATRKSFDGGDAGLPEGQVFSTCTPYYLNPRGSEDAQTSPMELLENLARASLSVSTQTVEDAMTGVCWKQEEDKVAQGLVGCGGEHLRTEVRPYPGRIMGSYSAVLQAELIGLARATPLYVMGMHFPHARQQILEQDLPDVTAKGPRQGRL